MSPPPRWPLDAEQARHYRLLMWQHWDPATGLCPLCLQRMCAPWSVAVAHLIAAGVLDPPGGWTQSGVARWRARLYDDEGARE